MSYTFMTILQLQTIISTELVNLHKSKQCITLHIHNMHLDTNLAALDSYSCTPKYALVSTLLHRKYKFLLACIADIFSTAVMCINIFTSSNYTELCTALKTAFQFRKISINQSIYPCQHQVSQTKNSFGLVADRVKSASAVHKMGVHFISVRF